MIKRICKGHRKNILLLSGMDMLQQMTVNAKSNEKKARCRSSVPDHCKIRSSTSSRLMCSTS